MSLEYLFCLLRQLSLYLVDKCLNTVIILRVALNRCITCSHSFAVRITLLLVIISVCFCPCKTVQCEYSRYVGLVRVCAVRYTGMRMPIQCYSSLMRLRYIVYNSILLLFFFSLLYIKFVLF